MASVTGYGLTVTVTEAYSKRSFRLFQLSEPRCFILRMHIYVLHIWHNAIQTHITRNWHIRTAKWQMCDLLDWCTSVFHIAMMQRLKIWYIQIWTGYSHGYHYGRAYFLYHTFLGFRLLYMCVRVSQSTWGVTQASGLGLFCMRVNVKTLFNTWVAKNHRWIGLWGANTCTCS